MEATARVLLQTRNKLEISVPFADITPAKYLASPYIEKMAKILTTLLRGDPNPTVCGAVGFFEGQRYRIGV